MTIDPTFAVVWRRVADRRPSRSRAEAGAAGSGFSSMLAQSIQPLADRRPKPRSAAQALATGQASDPTAVVMAVERAQLSMQMASQIRTKAVEAAQTIFQTQV